MGTRRPNLVHIHSATKHIGMPGKKSIDAMRPSWRPRGVPK
jgi:hypothetical protein